MYIGTSALYLDVALCVLDGFSDNSKLKRQVLHTAKNIIHKAYSFFVCVCVAKQHANFEICKMVT